MSVDSYKVLVLGAGAGGISVAARLRRVLAAEDIAIVDPSTDHYYQPMWTLAGAGVAAKEPTRRAQADVIPRGVAWIQDRVQRVEAERNEVRLACGRVLRYRSLVVATGLRLDWQKIEGLAGSLGRDGICSIYEYDQVDRTADMIRSFRGGRAIFVMPPVPIKCAGAPQKIMYLADDVFRRNGVRDQSEIFFATAGKAMFGVPAFSKALAVIAGEKDIRPLFQHKLVRVNPAAREAVFLVTNEAGHASEQTLRYDLLHVVPPMSAHPYVAESGLSDETGDQAGWLGVDKHSLQHRRFPNIFGIGDVTGIPNSKTAAAVRKQAPIVVGNVLSELRGETPSAKYDGYSSCPLVTEIGKVMLAEFGYDGKLMPSFPLDPTVPRRSMWILKKYLLPRLYWNGMLRGRA